MKEFFRFVAEIDEVVKQQNWSLVKNVNKGYVSFKAGFFNRFGINWTGSKTFAVFAKISEAEVKALTPAPARYESQWKQAIYVIDPKNTNTAAMVPIFKAAYLRT